MGLVNGIWHDNQMKTYPKQWNKHQFQMGKNSKGIPIIVCKDCKESRMYIMMMEEENAS